MANKEKTVKQSNNKGRTRTQKAGSDIMGLFMLLVVLSGMYATYIVVAGTEGIEPKIMVTPLALWLALKLVNQFVKR